MAATGSDIITTTAFELIGVGLMALLASTNDQMGTIVVIVMIGFALAWALSHTGFMEKYLGKPEPIDPVFNQFIK
jgi:hypothetical protein